MNRATSARNKEGDEIPLARRSRPVRSKNPLQQKIIFSISFVLASFLVLIFSNFLSARDIFYQMVGLENFSDNRLLGHYPYPEASRDDLVTVYPGLMVHKEVLFDLEKMRADANRSGVRIVLLSGFRSVELQNEIFYENKSLRNQVALERARVSAPPGYSEHSTGYAIDLGDASRRDTDFEVEFEETQAFKWLKTNAAKYHFILSFPKDNSQKVSYEPWHWRYEGTVKALEQFKKVNK